MFFYDNTYFLVVIAAVLTIFTTILLPTLRRQIQGRMHCADAICADCKSTDIHPVFFWPDLCQMSP